MHYENFPLVSLVSEELNNVQKEFTEPASSKTSQRYTLDIYASYQLIENQAFLSKSRPPGP